METEVRRGRRVVRLTRLERVWWPEEGIRKADVVGYYRRIAPVLLAHVRDRPFTIKQHYHGPRSPFPLDQGRTARAARLDRDVAAACAVARRRARSYPLVNDELALLWMVEHGCVDLHVWPSRADRPERPDFVLFDLDPAGVPFREVVLASRLLRDALSALGLESVAMTAGGDGMHVRVPIARRHTHAEARRFAEVVAGGLVRAQPDVVTTGRSRERRRGVFVDTKMNGHGQQVVAPYSVRPRPGGPVAALAWDEIDERMEPGRLPGGAGRRAGGARGRPPRAAPVRGTAARPRARADRLAWSVTPSPERRRSTRRAGPARPAWPSRPRPRRSRGRARPRARRV